MNSTGQTFSKTSITNYLKKNEKNYITISIFTEFPVLKNIFNIFSI